MRFHVLGVIGQPITKENSSCAYTQKVRRFANMMTARGHTVLVYGPEERGDIHPTEYVACYPHYKFEKLIENGTEWDHERKPWRMVTKETARELKKRFEPGDFLCCTVGRCHMPLAKKFPEAMAVETGIGYSGIVSEYCAFESRAWQHAVYGERFQAMRADGRFYDVVIPNFFDPEDFIFEAKKEDYVLYVGRRLYRKGLEVASLAAEAAGAELLIAGSGDYTPDYGECLGHVGPETRSELMSRARALLCPTLYLEPFGAVAVEAQLSGTPAISTDWGAFTETIDHGLSGYRCHTLGEFVAAIERADELDPLNIRARAEGLYSTEVVAVQYEQWFEQLSELYGAGWNSLSPGRLGGVPA